jgi:hypothetical protein
LSFVYLFLLLCVSSLATLRAIERGIAEFVATSAETFIQQIPEIQITDGEVSTDVPEPHYINDPETGDVIVIIDTTGQITSLEETDAFLLLTRTQVFAKKSDHETRVHDLSEVDGISLDRVMIRHWLEVGAAWAPLVIYPFLVIGAFLWRVIQILFYGVLGLGVKAVLRSELEYPALVSIAIMAITPAVLLQAGLGSSGLTPPWPITFAISMAYLIFGIKAASAPDAGVGPPSSLDYLPHIDLPRPNTPS